MSGYICPKCFGELEPSVDGHSLKCKGGHTYDIARSGYVNLLLSDRMNAKLPGDNKLMVSARRSFLDKGYYSGLLNEFCNAVSSHAHDGCTIFDAGCGEGYYTSGIARRLKADGISATLLGMDISKTAVDAAAKRCKDVFFSVGSVFHIPLSDGSCDIMTTLFAPYCGDEFNRIIKKDGTMIMVIPSQRHLFGLKAAVYDKPYLNEVKDFALDGFTLEGRVSIENEIFLPCCEDIQNLFSMTPYYYKTGESDQKKLAALTELKTEIGFEILTYKKK